MSRVLVVDDDIAEISAVKRVLTRAGHEPVLATNSADAMAVIHQRRPALLVLSATCEGGEALTLARALGENAETADLPLLVVGDADPLPRGARRLARPLDPELLTAELNAVIAPQDGVAISLEDEDGARPPPAPAASRPAPARAAPAKPAPRTAAPKPGSPPRPGAAARPAPEKAPEKAAPATAPTAPPHGAVAIGRLQPPRAAGLSDAAASRRAAAEALRARAEELRRSSGGTVPAAAAPPPASDTAAPPGPATAPAPRSAPAAVVARPAPGKAPADGAAAPSSVPRPSPVLIAPIAADASGSSLSESLDLGDFESTLRQAESAIEQGGGDARSAAVEARERAADEALQALEEEATRAAEAARSRRAAGARGDTDAGEAPPWIDPPGESPPRERPPRESRAAAEERALQEAIETARREAFETAKRDASETARREAFEEARRELQEQARKEAAEAARLIQAEARARQEALASAEREARELAQREADARERAAAAEREVQALRSQLDEERRKGEERVATVMQRAAEEEEAAEESHRVHAAEEQKLRDAIASARSEMEALRKRHEEEARRREEAEYALRRLEGAGRDRAPAPDEGGPGAAEVAPEFSTPSFFEPFDGAEAAAPAPAEEAARRRVAALRSGEPEPEQRSATAIEPAATAAISASPDEPLSPEEPARPLPQPPPQLRGGDLAELPAPRLLAQAHRARLDGRLDFRGDTARSLWFEEGRVVGASSADPAERVEEVALRLGLITRDQHRQIAQSAAALSSRRAAMLLLERGFLKATELTALVRRRTEEVVFGVFADAEARFRWMGVEVPPEERTALERGTLALAVEGVRRRWLAPRVDALLGGPATLLAPVPGGPGPAELGLSPEERRVAALADGLRALDEILQGSPLDALSTRQLLAALVLTGALSIRSLQAGRPAGHALAAIDLARVREKLEQVRRADYFTVLGVGRLCTPHEVRDAARRLENEFDPRRYPTQGDEGLPARLAEILQVVHDAREVLADERLREEYLRGLGEPG